MIANDLAAYDAEPPTDDLGRQAGTKPMTSAKWHG
jgi:hypothetical protein